MSTTLTNGLKLPDKGSVDWYADMQSNYAILDGAVGTVAEHTSALAGKAPLVHTHGKADITDLFNSANTWTEDNTYSKTVTIERSTDTGNFLALKNSVAELGSTPASATPVTIAYRDKNNDNLGYMGVYYDTDGSNHFRLYVRNKFTSGAPSTSGSLDYAYFGLKLNADKSKEGILKASLRPYDNNTYDLGSSSYQWNNVYCNSIYSPAIINSQNAASPSDSSVSSIVALRSIITYTSGDPDANARLNFRLTGTGEKSFYPHETNQYSFGLASRQWNNLYAKNYYYNGVAWGLDKANVWTGENSFSSNVNFSSNVIITGNQLKLYDKNDQVNTTPSSSITKNIQFTDKNNTVIAYFSFQHRSDSSEPFRTCWRQQKLDGTNNYYSVAFNNLGEFYPETANISLGTSTKKWKTLNGVNPGALSFPKIGTTENVDYINVLGNIDVSVTSAQTFVAPVTGWFCISFKYDKVTSCRISAFNMRGDCAPIGSDGYVGCYIPVTEGVTVTVRVDATAIYNARIYKCQGNV